MSLLTVFSATFVALILCEIILRIAGISYPVFDTYDKLRGVALRPYKEGWYRYEGEGYLQINSLGYRDIEHSINKPPKTFRIAILGDSFSEARQVALEDTFWNYLKKNIDGCPVLAGKTTEVLNFGIGGYNTTQELLTLQHHVWQFLPDVVLLAFFPGNDISDNSKKLLQGNSNWRNDFRPFHVLKNDQLVLDNSFRAWGWKFAWKYFLYEGVHYSKILESINYARHVWKTKKIKQQEQKTTQKWLEGDMIYRPPKSAVWKEAWLITEKLLFQMNQYIKQHHAVFVLATLSTGIQVHPDSTKREKFQRDIGVENLFYLEQQVHSMGKKHGFSTITLAQPLQKIATQQGIYLHGFKNTKMGKGHWNENGHRFAGEILAKELCTKVLP